MGESLSFIGMPIGSCQETERRCALSLHATGILKNLKAKLKINLPLGEMENEVPFHQYEDMEECLKKEQPDLVDVCLPTSLHANITIDLLKRGYAVLCEKPMASSYEDCLSMLAAAKDGKNPLMIGQCLRFYPEYEYLQKIVESGVYGKVIESDFYRFSPPPFWSNDNWQMDINRSGGCLVELNIHDIDYIRWCFGEPEKISCRIESRVTPQDAVESHFSYPEHTVKVRSAWVSPEEPFWCTDIPCVFRKLW